MAFRSCSVLDILLPPIIIMMQDCPEALHTCKCLWSLSCGGASNMLRVISITFHCHYYMCGCMWPISVQVIEMIYLKLMLLSSSNRKYQPYPLLSYFPVVVCLRYLLHHILSLITYTFRENWDFVFIIIVQIMMNANSRIRFGLQIVFICLYITPSH